MARTDRPQPIPLPEQEWLLEGRPVDQVLICRDGSPARIVAPDPRWFALQKLWMSEQSKRHPLKRGKDLKQALLLLDAIAEAMPHYPLDDAFEARLPGELAPYYVRWAEQRSEEHTSELQSLMRISYAVFCLTKKINILYNIHNTPH